MKKYFLGGVALVFSNALFPATIELSEAIKIATDSHPAINVYKSNFQAESKSIVPLYFPDNPMIGIMKQSGMTSWIFSQEILFPTKYFYRGLAQSKRASVASVELKQKIFEIRQEVITAYYDLYVQKKIVENLGAQKELLREIARFAENRRAIGQVTSQDEMKAHLEQSKIENEIIDTQQEVQIKIAKLKELLGNDNDDFFDIGKLEHPSLTISSDQLKNLSFQEIPALKIASFQVDETNALKNFIGSSFFPDFKISLQYSIENDNDDKSIALEMKFPIWFWAKESGDYATITAKSIATSQNWEARKREVFSKQRSLTAKIVAKESVLKLYQTTLIPQSKSTINASRAAYQAGRASLMEFLDSERIVYGLQISYYLELKEFTEAIAEYESNMGQLISSLPSGGVL